MPTQLLAGLDILVIEDESLLCKRIAAHLESLGADVTGVGTLGEAGRALLDLSFDFVLLDVNLPDGRGTTLMEQKRVPNHTGVIVMTAEGGVAGAVDAMKLGALDYLVKPFEVEELSLVISRARRERQIARLHEHEREQDPAQGLFFGEALAPLRSQLDKILAADRRVGEHLPPVLIDGETGTGKTSIARWLHRQGPRRDRPLVEINCSALPETLAESELFGHERGAFTDARSARMGLFEAASGGSLLLDELPSLSLSLQAKVLKVIEDHRIRRLGGTREIPVDVRIIAATHRDLNQLVAVGEFREDLFHRLDLYRLGIPPLRERRMDVVALATRLLERLCQKHHVPARTISSDGRRRLASHSWPGNVRELAHELERAIVFEEGTELEFGRLQRVEEDPAAVEMEGWFNPSFRFPERGFELEQAVRKLIDHALEQTGQNVSAAARLLGVTRDYIRYRVSGEKDGRRAGE